MLARLILLPGLVFAGVEFGNSLIGAPKINCEHGSITLDVSTEKGAPSYVFAKNHYNKEGCSFKNTSHVTFNFDHCNVNRKREVQPKRGMSYSLTVMVQLHPLFITKVDRAYQVHCFYMEADKSVGTQMEVKDLNSTEIAQDVVAPICQYTLHKDSINGANVQRVKVGDPIYHVWECPSDSFAMLIHSCVVYDGSSGNEVPVIDENGCSLDPFLMPELTYSKDLTKTFTPSSAFNFPDVQQVYFNCRIKLCPRGPNKENDCSGITPPRCGLAAQTNIDNEAQADSFNPQRTISESKEQADSTEKASVADELESERLIPTETAVPLTTTAPATTHVETTVRDVTDGKTTVILQTTTVLPPTPVTVTATPPATTSTESFPTPRSFASRQQSDFVVEEGSGLEIAALRDTQPLRVLASTTPIAKAPLRDLKRRDTLPNIDVDIASPELTVLDRDYELPEPLGQHAMQPTTPAPQNENSVCLPMFSLWAMALLMVFCLTLLTIAVFRTCMRRDKFMPY